MQRALVFLVLLVGCGHKPYTSLHLSFTTEAGTALELDFQLWRLDPDGDRIVVEKTLPAHGEWLELEPGRYRVYSPWLRRGADDPPAFEVVRGENRQRLVLPTCRSRRLSVKVVDEHGAPVERAILEPGVWCGQSGGCGTLPAWARPAPGLRRPGGHVTASGRPVPDKSIVAGPHGFDLGTEREANRGTEFFCLHTITIDGCESIRVDRTHESRAFDLVAVAIPREAIERSVYLPTGGRATKISVRVDAVPAGTSAFPVRIEVEGHEPVRVEFRPGGALPVVRLTRVSK